MQRACILHLPAATRMDISNILEQRVLRTKQKRLGSTIDRFNSIFKVACITTAACIAQDPNWHESTPTRTLPLVSWSKIHPWIRRIQSRYLQYTFNHRPVSKNSVFRSQWWVVAAAYLVIGQNDCSFPSQRQRSPSMRTFNNCRIIRQQQQAKTCSDTHQF